MAARKTPRDPHAAVTRDRHRLLTIGQGTRLTPAVVNVLQALIDEADRLSDEENRTTFQNKRTALAVASPVLVARSDGLAVYVFDRRLG